MSVVPFRKPDPPESWIGGIGLCIGCRHEWAAAAPTGTIKLECPSCGSMKGIFKYPVGGKEGDAVFACNCGCEALTAYTRAGKFWLRCMSCGIDQTSAVFGEP